MSKKKADSLLNLPEEETTRVEERRGNSLLGQIGDDTLTSQRVVEEVPLGRIRPNPFQPRWAADESTIRELAHSMQQRGFFGALTARRRGRWYELAYGHQRLEAARRVELATLPLEVRELSDEEMLEYALSENLQRKDLSQLEEGEMFLRWQEELGRSEREIAERLGKSRGYVRNRIETARLPDDLKEILREQASHPSLVTEEGLPPRFELSAAAAKELARIQDGAERRQLVQEVLSRQLNYRQTKALVERASNPPRAVSRRDGDGSEHLFGSLMRRLEAEARRVPAEERQEAIRALDELIARAEQLKESLRTMR
ncbi:MAG: ParB/RepB/Spo0J family partition protein [Chloroflexota bacterium]|nr:ParB/RepB/Spo0J family partition protein [Chloroflexota bacterium]